ncbi:immunoglobulin superfamily member 10 [Tachyglossus aculeatus]|uniref:immunoglobulin superfamily member 10 n=1 Tax=Tachyglossus aculeatus TaxID=9261 RepID=UPI0018F56751|nr:immunoglobulin superfamily member 10 [Tachyglossus aculeatus]
MSGFAPRRRVKGRGNPCLLVSSSFFFSICLAALPGTGACPRRCACYVPTEVHCTFRYLTALPEHISPNVERINLGYNSMVKLTEKNFLGLNHLELLMLHSNAIHTIPDKVFTGLPALQVLKMSYNKVRKLHKDTFYGLKSLIRLHMDHNNIEFINPEAFHGLSALRLVHLEGNFLTKLHPDTFVSLRFLQTFPISFIKHIYLSDNFLTSLPQEMVSQMPDLESLYLHGNPWICDCGLEWFPGWMERNPDVVKCKRDRNGSAAQQCPVCTNPRNFKDRLLAEIPASALVCTKPAIDPTLKLRNSSLSEEGDFTLASPKEFVAPIGSMDLNMADHSGNEAKLVCDIQKPSIRSPISLPHENDLSLLNVSFSTFLVCNIDSTHIQTLWRILALYSVSPLRMERSHLLTEMPHISYKYKQVTSESEDIFTNVEAEVRAEPMWLMQDHFLLQLDRTATTLSTLHISFWTEAQITLPPVGDGEQRRYKWTTICRDNSTKLQHTVLVGETVDLNCPGHGDPVPHVEWILADGSRVKAPYVSEDGRILINKAGKLELQTADSFDAGIYHCISTNYGDADVLTYRVVVVEPDLGDRHVNGARRMVVLGETIDLPCQSIGVPDASVSWVLPGPILLHQSSRNKHIFSNGTLRVQRVTPRDGGLYQCVVANLYGVDFLTFRVSVESTENALGSQSTLTRDDGETDGSGQEEHKIAIKVTELPPERTDGTPPPAMELVGRNARKGQPHSGMSYHHRGDYRNRPFRGHRRQFPPSMRRIDPQHWAAFLEKTKKNSPPEKPENNTSTPMTSVKQFSKGLGDGEGSSGASPPEEEFLLPVTKTLTISANASTSKPIPSGNTEANISPVLEATPAGIPWLFSTEKSETVTSRANLKFSPSVTAMPKKTNINQASLINGQEVMKQPATTFSSLLTNTGEFRKVDQMSVSLGKGNEQYKKTSEELVEETIKDINFEKSHMDDKVELLIDSGHHTSLSTVSRPRDERFDFHTTQKTTTPNSLPGSTITAHHQIQVITDVVTNVPMSRYYGRRRKMSGRRRIIRPNRIPSIRERYNFARLRFKGFAEERTTFLPTAALDHKCSSCTSGPMPPAMPVHSVTPRISYSTPTLLQVNAPTAPHAQSTTLPTRPTSPIQEKKEPNLEVEKPTPTIRFFYAESTQVTPQNDSVTNAPRSIHTEQIPSMSISSPTVFHTLVSANVIWETAPVTSSSSVDSATSLTSGAQPTVRALRRKIPWHHIFVHSPVQKETINSHEASSHAGITPRLPQITPVQSTVGNFPIHLKTISTREDQKENFLPPTRATVAHDNLLERHSPQDPGVPVQLPSLSLTPHLASSTADSATVTFPSLPRNLATITQTQTARPGKQIGQRRKRPQKRITTAQSMTSWQSPAFPRFGTTSPSVIKMVRTLMLPPVPEYSPSPTQDTSGVPVRFSPTPVSLHVADVTKEISRVTMQTLKTSVKMAGPRKPLEVTTLGKSTFTLPAIPWFVKGDDHTPATPPTGTQRASIGYPEQPSTLISDTTRAGLPQTSRVDTLQLPMEVPPDSRGSPNTKSPDGTTCSSNPQHLDPILPLVTVPSQSSKDKTTIPQWSNKFEHKSNSEVSERHQPGRENPVTEPKSNLPTTSLHTLGQEREKVDSIESSFDQAANQEITGSYRFTLDSLPRKGFEKPRIIGGKAGSFMVLVNSDAFIPCEASGTPHPTIYWSRVSSGLIIAGGRQEGRFRVFANGTLSIQDARVQDRGQYLCVAVNPQGSDRLLVTLSVVTYPPRILGSRTREMTIHVGSSAEVSCRAEGRPPPARSWILANKTIVQEASKGNRVSVKPDGTLVIRSLTVYDRGVYTCLARNPAGMDSLSVKIQVIAAPPFILEEKRQHVVGTWGGGLKLPCTVEGNPQPTVHWVLSDGTEVKPLQLVNARWFLLANGTLYTQNLATSDSGRYECIATSSTGSERRVVNLMIERRDSVPSIETASPKVTVLNLGDPLLLNCLATGKPDPRIIWRLPSRAVIDRWHRMGSRIHVFPNGSLVIRAMTDKDAGDYLCVARNKMGEDMLLMKVNLRMKAAQIDHKQHFKKQVPYGKDFRVDCKASGSPVPEISWSLPDGTMVNNVMQADDGGHRSRRYILFDNGTLYFNKVGMAEEGDYTCYAQNTLGKDEMKVHLTVVPPAPRIRQSPKSHQRVRAGETVVLDCEVNGEPSPKIFWLLPSSDKVASSNDRYMLHANGSLSISKVKLLDSGEYVCVARNFGGDDTKVYKLDVIARPPAINSWFRNKTVIKTTAVRHSKKHIDCRAEGTPPPQVMWIMPDHIFLTAPYYGSRITVHPNGTLEIRNVRPSDTAEFTCVARNDGGESVLVVQLEVLEMLRRPTFRNPFNEKVIALPGTSTTLNCSVDGNPPPEIIWILPNGTQFPARAGTARLHIRSNGSLVIQNPTRDDAGRYRCTAKNQVGYIEKLIILEVAQKPVILTYILEAIKGISGQSLSLHCVSSGSPKPTMTWTVPGGRVIDRPHAWGRYILHENGTLVIQKATIHDRGNYICKAKNGVGVATVAVPVMIVAYAPQITNRPPRSIHTVSGAAVQLNCVALGIPKPEIMWEMPDHSVLSTAGGGSSSGSELLRPQGTLVIQNPQTSDSGEYKCTAKNRLGWDSAMTYIQVH